MFNCPFCGSAVPDSERLCPACGRDIGFPNVRKASLRGEEEELFARLAQANASTRARECDNVLQRFGNAVDVSFAAISRSLNIVQNLLDNEHMIYTSFHQQIEEGARTPENNYYDVNRTKVDAALFPNYFKHIKFGCLTLNAGLAGYSGYTMILKTSLIDYRATVFEENPFRFIERHHVALTDPIPLGYRATWQNRSVLARAKLHPSLTRDTPDTAFPTILLSNSGGRMDDFVEVHIYGSINRSTVERLIGPKPTTKEDRLIWRSLEKKLPKLGIPVETV